MTNLMPFDTVCPFSGKPLDTTTVIMLHRKVIRQTTTAQETTPQAPTTAPRGRTGSRGDHRVWYAERPRGRRASRGRGAARCLAPHSRHRTAAPRPGECPAAAGRCRRGCPAGPPGTRRAVVPDQAALEQAHAMLVALRGA